MCKNGHTAMRSFDKLMQKKGMNIKVLLKPDVDLFRRVTYTNTNGKLRPNLEASKKPFL